VVYPDAVSATVEETSRIFCDKELVLVNSSGRLDTGCLKPLQHILVFSILQLPTEEEWEGKDLERRTIVLAEDGQIELDPQRLVLDEQRDAARDLGNLEGDGDPSDEVPLELADLDSREERNLDEGCDHGVESLLVDESTKLRAGSQQSIRDEKSDVWY